MSSIEEYKNIAGELLKYEDMIKINGDILKEKIDKVEVLVNKRLYGEKGYYYVLELYCDPGGCRKSEFYVYNSFNKIREALIKDLIQPIHGLYIATWYGEYMFLHIVNGKGKTLASIDLHPYIEIKFENLPKIIYEKEYSKYGMCYRMKFVNPDNVPVKTLDSLRLEFIEHFVDKEDIENISVSWLEIVNDTEASYILKEAIPKLMWSFTNRKIRKKGERSIRVKYDLKSRYISYDNYTVTINIDFASIVAKLKEYKLCTEKKRGGRKKSYIFEGVNLKYGYNDLE